VRAGSAVHDVAVGILVVHIFGRTWTCQDGILIRNQLGQKCKVVSSEGGRLSQPMPIPLMPRTPKLQYGDCQVSGADREIRSTQCDLLEGQVDGIKRSMRWAFLDMN
jgi:hypothetical protein